VLVVAAHGGHRRRHPLRPAEAREYRLADELHLAEAATMLERSSALEDTVRCAMLVGHNPGLEDLASLLVGSGDAALHSQLAAKFPTGAPTAAVTTGVPSL
jgi:phosphohistidine phosphatase